MAPNITREKNPYEFACARAAVNQVNCVTWLMGGRTAAMFIRPEIMKPIIPRQINWSGTLDFMPADLPFRVPKVLSPAASSGTSVQAVAAVLKAGIQAGTGAVFGMPHHGPNRMSVQNVSSARYRLWSSVWASLGTK